MEFKNIPNLDKLPKEILLSSVVESLLEENHMSLKRYQQSLIKWQRKFLQLEIELQGLKKEKKNKSALEKIIKSEKKKNERENTPENEIKLKNSQLVKENFELKLRLNTLKRRIDKNKQNSISESGLSWPIKKQIFNKRIKKWILTPALEQKELVLKQNQKIKEQNEKLNLKTQEVKDLQSRIQSLILHLKNIKT